MSNNEYVRRRILQLIGLLIFAALWWWAESGTGSGPVPPPTATHETPAAAPSTDPPKVPAGLPGEVAETLSLIDAGGPFPYRRDGVVFENRERRLPQHPRGYWREYTVPTPGSDDRGARRLVVGSSGEVYYSADHYGSFRLIRPAPGDSGGDGP